MTPSQQQHSRINVAELKAQIVKKIGHERSNRYFSYLTRLLSQKLSKAEYNKLCHLTVGEENFELHNEFISSILKNAYDGKVPPPLPADGLRPTASAVKSEDGYLPSPLFSSGNQPIWSNVVDAIPITPKRGRTTKRDARTRDHPSPLGPNGRLEGIDSHAQFSSGQGMQRVLENGDVSMCDLERPVNHVQGIAEQPDHEAANLVLPPPSRRPRLNKSTHDPPHVNSEGLNVVLVEERDEVKLPNSGPLRTRGLIEAPLGIPFCSARLGSAWKAASHQNVGMHSKALTENASSSGSTELSDAETLRKRMEHIAECEGLQGVTTDCANMLNNGLDSHLKQLIRSCVDLTKARSGHGRMKHLAQKQHAYGKVVCGINGMWSNHLMNAHTNNGSIEGTRQAKARLPVSFMDFRVAMELNPQLLGDDWPVLLEKISFRSIEEE